MGLQVPQPGGGRKQVLRRFSFGQWTHNLTGHLFDLNTTPDIGKLIYILPTQNRLPVHLHSFHQYTIYVSIHLSFPSSIYLHTKLGMSMTK